MTSCPEQKGLIDRYLDLEPTDKANLDRHLEACASCAEYKADADKTAQLLRELRRRLTSTEPVDRALERLSLRLAASKRQLVWALVLIAACVTAPFAMMLRGGLAATGFALLAVGAVVAVVAGAALIRQNARDQAALVGLTKRTAGFYEAWKQDLQQRIRMTTGGTVLVSLWSVGFLFYSVLGPFGLVERLVVLGTAFLLAVGALHTFFVELRQLKDELGLVRDASGG